MTTHSEKRIVPYSADQMYDLISDISLYPEFLPWCAATRIRARRPEGAQEIIDADMVISFKVFREKFGSRVVLDEDARKIDVSYLDGPFSYLNNNWKFIPQADGGCEIDFFVDFEFKSRTLQALIGMVFNQAMQQVVRAFEKRADELYGSGDQPKV